MICTTSSHKDHYKTSVEILLRTCKAAPQTLARASKTSDPTRTKCQESCTSHVKIRTTPQRRRSDTQEVTRRLDENLIDVRNTLRAARNICEKICLPGLGHYCACHKNVSLRHRKCCTCQMESSSCPKSIMTTISQKSAFNLVKTSPSSPNTAPATKNDFKNHLSV